MIKKLIAVVVLSVLAVFYVSLAVSLGATAFGGLKEVYMEATD
jgi:hypothetical protein